MNNFQISSDGTIFAIKEDGSIKQLGKIDKKGTIVTNKKSIKYIWWITTLILIISSAVGFILYITAYNDLEYYEDRYHSERSSLTDLKSEIISVAPFVIYNVEIGNKYKGGEIETDYGKTIYSYRTMYLTPKIYYKGFKADDYELKIKLFRPSGYMSTGSSSPYGYSLSGKYSMSEGSHTKELSGWGNETKGHWESGEYRLEIWYNEKCVFLKLFRIYS